MGIKFHSFQKASLSLVREIMDYKFCVHMNLKAVCLFVDTYAFLYLEIPQTHRFYSSRKKNYVNEMRCLRDQKYSDDLFTLLIRQCLLRLYKICAVQCH